MPLVKKKIVIETEMINVRISKDLTEKLKLYCAFTGRNWEERHEVFEGLLAYAMERDTDFKKGDPGAGPIEAKEPRKRKEKAVRAAPAA